VGQLGRRGVMGGAVALLVAVASVLEAQTPGVVDQNWLSWDPGTRTVHFKLTAGLTGLNGALNFNGFRDGGLTLVVPAGSPMVVEFENHDGMLPHSAQVILNMRPVPGAAMDQAAIARAYTDKVGEGLPPQSKDRMRFTATPAGEYLFFCGVPGHGLAGMWIRLSVSDTAREPALLATPKS